MGKIIVPALPTDGEMRELLQSLIDDNESDLSNALNHDVPHIDRCALLDAVRITDVDINVSQIEVAYELAYSIYNGCKDLDILNPDN